MMNSEIKGVVTVSINSTTLPPKLVYDVDPRDNEFDFNPYWQKACSFLKENPDSDGVKVLESLLLEDGYVLDTDKRRYIA